MKTGCESPNSRPALLNLVQSVDVQQMASHRYLMLLLAETQQNKDRSPTSASSRSRSNICRMASLPHRQLRTDRSQRCTVYISLVILRDDLDLLNASHVQSRVLSESSPACFFNCFVFAERMIFSQLSWILRARSIQLSYWMLLACSCCTSCSSPQRREQLEPFHPSASSCVSFCSLCLCCMSMNCSSATSKLRFVFRVGSLLKSFTSGNWQVLWLHRSHSLSLSYSSISLALVAFPDSLKGSCKSLQTSVAPGPFSAACVASVCRYRSKDHVLRKTNMEPERIF